MGTTDSKTGGGLCKPCEIEHLIHTKLPVSVLFKISRFECESPTRAVQLSHVCKTWRNAIQDNKISHHLWERLVKLRTPAFQSFVRSSIRCHKSPSTSTTTSPSISPTTTSLGMISGSGSATSITLGGGGGSILANFAAAANARKQKTQTDNATTNSPSTNSPSTTPTTLALGGSGGSILANLAAAANARIQKSQHDNDASPTTSSSAAVSPASPGKQQEGSSSASSATLLGISSNRKNSSSTSGSGLFQILSTSQVLEEDSGALSDGELQEDDPDVVVSAGTVSGEDLVKFSRNSCTSWIVEKLLFLGKQNPNYRSRKHNDSTALIVACENGAISVVPLILMSKKVDINARGAHGKTALLAAISKGDVTMSRFLLQKGADPNISDRVGNQPIFECVSNMCDNGGQLLDLLLETGKVDVNAYHEQRVSPCFEAVRNNQYEALKKLLEAGADPLAAVEKISHVTCLMLAVKNAQTRIVKLLLDHIRQKSDDVEKLHEFVNQTNSTRNTALMNAAVVGDKEAAKLLIAAGASINVRNAHSQSALSLAQDHDSQLVVKLLEEEGADP